MKNSNAAFSHVISAYYAGIGTIGDSHNLITKEFGPGVRIVSVLTDALIEPDPKLEKNLCIHCKKCLRSCPSQCFKEVKGSIYDMDKVKCTEYHVKLKNEHHWPCGICANICPIGDDLKIYRKVKDVTLKGIKHCQAFGS